MIQSASTAAVAAVSDVGWGTSPTAFLVYVTTAATLATVGMVIAAFRSTRDTRRALDLAEQQAEITRKEADTAEATRRAALVPWLSLRDQPSTMPVNEGVLVSAAVQSIGPGWARIDSAHLELANGGRISLVPGVGMTPPHVGEKMTTVVSNTDPLQAELLRTEFPTFVVHCLNAQGDDGRIFRWERVGDEWIRTDVPDGFV